MDFLIRLVQVHGSFRRPELEALAALHGTNIDFIEYDESLPFCVVRLSDRTAARNIIGRAILAHSIHELWATGECYNELHTNIKNESRGKWPAFKSCSFKFTLDSYQHSRTMVEQRDIVESFSYLPFEGPIRLSGSDEQFTVFEHFDLRAAYPKRIYFGRLIGNGSRDLINDYTLKKRKYISTTSMDSELALVGANLTLASPGKLFYDPFVGTGSLTIACSHFGAMALGSDMDGRCIRGKQGVNIKSSFAQYNLEPRYLDGFVSDLTHSPLRDVTGGWLNGIVCDPPYGIREGLKVLGSKDGSGKEIIYIDGKPAHLAEGYIPPRRQYSFDAMLSDILNFAADILICDGRLSMWMPTANDEAQELEVPMHPALDILMSEGSRRLITYRKKFTSEITGHCQQVRKPDLGGSANDLNRFRKRFFQGFKTEALPSKFP